MDVDHLTNAVTRAGRRIIDWWDALWFGDVAPEIYAVLRVLFGLVGCVSLIGLLNVPLFWSCSGLVASRGDTLCRALAPVGLSWLYPGSILCFAAISFAAMTVGYLSRLSTICAFAAITLTARWNDLPLSAAHQVLRAMVFCLIWADGGQAWSVDAWLRRADCPPGRERRVPAWPLRLMRLQVGAVYLVTGLWKMNSALWRDGSALHYVFENAQFRRFTFLASPSLDQWTTLATYGTLAWELAFPFLLIRPRTRRWALAVGIVIHVGMWATLELGPFSAVMLASYVAFCDPENLRRRLEAWSSGTFVAA